MNDPLKEISKIFFLKISDFNLGYGVSLNSTDDYENNKLLPTQSNVLDLDQSMNSVRSYINNPNLKYQRFNLSGCKDIGICGKDWIPLFGLATILTFLLWLKTFQSKVYLLFA